MTSRVCDSFRAREDDYGTCYCGFSAAAHGPAASPTDVVSENNRVGSLKALFADPAAGPPTEGWDESRCRVCGWPLSKSRADGCVTDDCSMRPRPRHRADGAAHPDAASPSGETGTGEGEQHAELLERMASGPNVWPALSDPRRAALRAGAEALQDNAILDMNLSAAREEIEALAEGQAQLRERVRVLEVFLNEYAAHHERCNRVPCDCGFDAARAALAPPADRTTKED